MPFDIAKHAHSLSSLPDNWVPSWTVEALWQTHGVNMLFGAPRAHKSTLRDYLIACAFAQRPALGRFATTAPQKALIVLGEGVVEGESTRLYRILDALGVERGELQNRITFLDPLCGVQLDSTPSLKALRSFIEGEGFDFVSFDPLFNLHRQKENDATAIGIVLQALRMLTDLATVVVVHHETKPSEGTQGRTDSQHARGSGAIIGFTEANARMRVLKPNRFKLSFDPKYGEKPEDMELVWDGREFHGVALTVFEEAVLATVRAHPSSSGKEIVGIMDKRRGDVYSALHKLAAVGLLVNAGGWVLALSPNGPPNTPLRGQGKTVPKASGTGGTPRKENEDNV